MNLHLNLSALRAAVPAGMGSYWFWYLFTIPGFRAR